MNLFRLFLFACLLVVASYTGVVIAQHGLNLLPLFIGDIAVMAWPGQFNVDFLLIQTARTDNDVKALLLGAGRTG